jgi:hypothetical protein
MSDFFKRDPITGASKLWVIAFMFLMKRARPQKSVVVAH